MAITQDAVIAPIGPPSACTASCSIASSSPSLCAPSSSSAPRGAGSTSTLAPLFFEVFAGCGELTQAVERVKIDTLDPQDYNTGGVDFSNRRAVEELWNVWRRRAQAGQRLFFHFAPTLQHLFACT